MVITKKMTRHIQKHCRPRVHVPMGKADAVFGVLNELKCDPAVPRLDNKSDTIHMDTLFSVSTTTILVTIYRDESTSGGYGMSWFMPADTAQNCAEIVRIYNRVLARGAIERSNSIWYCADLIAGAIPRKIVDLPT